MQRDNFTKDKIKLCLSCVKGHKVIRDYHEIYRMCHEKNISAQNIDMADKIKKVLECGDICEGKKILTQLRINYKRNDEIKELIDDAREELVSKKNQDISKRLLKYNFEESDKVAVEDLADVLGIEGSLLDKYEKLVRLSHGAPFEENDTECLKNLYIIIHAISTLYDEEKDEMINKHQNEVFVLKAMNERNKELGNIYKKKKVDNLTSNWERIDGEEKKKMRATIRDIFNQYCFNDFSQYKVDETRECGRQIFKLYVDNIDSVFLTKKNEITKRIEMLPETSQKIVCDYLKHAPKKFGVNLQRIMSDQQMTERFISNIIEMRSSTVQYLKECDIFKLEEKYLKQLCILLLVSEDVLKTGIGKRYGNWRDFLDEECIKGLQESNDLTDVNTKREAEGFVKEQIREIVKMDDAEFDEFLEKNSEYLYEEDYALYESTWEWFNALLHQDEFYTLLEVLERQS